MSSRVVVLHLPEAVMRLVDVLLHALRLTVTLYDAAVQRAILMFLGRLESSDLIQDLYGARSLLDHANLYPPIGVAAARLGVKWTVTGRSTHPPTTFLFLVPMARLPWPTVSSIWAILMMAAMLATAWAYRRTWSESLVLLPLVLWPPVLTSFSQFTAIWMLGIALAWRWRERPFVSGAAIAMASLTKFLPAVFIIPFLQKKNWYALAGFLAVWIIAVVLLLQVDPSAWHQYFSINQTTSLQQAGRSDNGALMSFYFRQPGTIFRILGILALSPLFITALVRAFRAPHLDQQTWEIWTWLSVSLLPIAWVYSLLPLLPAILRGVRSPTKATRTLAGLALFIPFLGATPASRPAAVALTVVLVGIVILLNPSQPRARGQILNESRGLERSSRA